MYKYAGILHKKMPVFFGVSEVLVNLHKETKNLLEINDVEEDFVSEYNKLGINVIILQSGKL